MVEQNEGKMMAKNDDLDNRKTGWKEVTNRFVDISQRKAAIIVGLGLIIMFVFAIVAEFLAFSNIIVLGDSTKTVNNIYVNYGLFGIGIASYIIILICDVLVAWALYIILKPVNKNLSLGMATLRLVYTSVIAISLCALMMHFPELWVNGKLIAYIFFIPHVFLLGYQVYKSDNIPHGLGVFLMIASICYVILMYGDILFPQELVNVMLPIAMIPATFAEISLGIWLLVKARKFHEMKNQDETAVEKTEAKAEVMMT